MAEIDALKETLKQQIIDALSLEDIQVSDIENDAPIFGEGLGLDSIDALELIMLLDKEYGIKLTNPQESKAIFQSINTLADYVTEHRTK